MYYLRTSYIKLTSYWSDRNNLSLSETDCFDKVTCTLGRESSIYWTLGTCEESSHVVFYSRGLGIGKDTRRDCVNYENHSTSENGV